MNWRNLFYFSKGERQALTVLLFLIVLSTLLLHLNDRPEEAVAPAHTAIPAPADSSQMAKEPQTVPQKSHSYATKTSRKSPQKRIKSFREAYKAPEKWVSNYPSKFEKGTLVELNSADTTTLKRVPGIGSVFARRIVKFRNILGGFYSVEQLSEVYGIDQERYDALKAWFTVDPSAIRKLPLGKIPADSLSRHPYISFRQARAIDKLVKQNGGIVGWQSLELLEEFTADDKIRLHPYLLFE